MSEVLKFSDSQILQILDKHFGVATSTSYSTVLIALAMISGPFSRSAVEKYCTSFLQAITENPNFCNPLVGGADEEIINQIFIGGISPKHFRETLARYNSKTILNSFDAITNKIPVYQRALDS